jgi:PIN domain nuclease of toxin-antitoxin system
MEDEGNDLYFSVVSLWEIGVKRALKRPEFNIDPRLLRGELLSEGYTELTVSAEHALAVECLPPLHKDPFDRLLLCQTLVEGLTLLTKDEEILAYPVSVRRQ